MKKRLPAFLAGALSALLVTALGTTALAASGKLSYNFANVSVNGERAITAGADLAVGEGKHIPGSILYIDETGGKTNYLPVRTIAELLGAEVGYDSATKTVLLSTGAETAGQTAPTLKSAGHWTAKVEDGFLAYTCDAEKAEHDTLPWFRPADLPEGWKLEETRGIGGGSSSSWLFETAGGGEARFLCAYPGTGRFSDGTFKDLEAAMKNKRQIPIQGYAADLYTETTNYGTRTLLAWEDSQGILFQLTGRDVPEAQLLQAARSMRAVSAGEASWKLTWLPDGTVGTPFERSVLGDTVQETQLSRGTNFTLLASPLPLAAAGEGPGEAVKVNGQEARFWAAREPMVPKEMKTQEGGSVTITSVTVSGYGAADMNTLLWSDPDTGTNFRLTSGLDQATMLRAAESVTR